MREMKDSGIAWIGEIPKNWKTCRLKDYAHICNGRDYSEVLDENGGYPVIGSGGQFAKGCKPLYQKESVLLGRKGTIDKPLFVDYPFWTVDTMYYTEIKENVSAKYFYYLCTQIEFDFYQYGSAVPSMTQRDLYNVDFPYPTLDEQRCIANYLDRKCSQIDAIIARQQEVIEKLKAYKLSVITEAVTKGLNPNVPMKDSRVEWIGEVPGNWTKVKLKNICQFINGDRSSNYPSPNEYVDNGIPFLGADSLCGRYVDVTQSKKITKEKYHSMGGAKIQKGDILYTLRGSTIGKNAIATFDEGTVASSLMVIRPISLIPEYLLYWLNSEEEFQQRQSYINGSTAPNLSAENVGSFVMFLPPALEQRKIADYLDTKCAEIELTMLKKQVLIDQLGNYKKSLIYEVVTGKKEV